MKIVIRPNWFIRLLDSISQLLNVLLLNGDANESISGRAFRSGWWIEHLIDMLFFWEEFHCENAYMSDLARAESLLKQNKEWLNG